MRTNVLSVALLAILKRGPMVHRLYLCTLLVIALAATSASGDETVKDSTTDMVSTDAFPSIDYGFWVPVEYTEEDSVSTFRGVVLGVAGWEFGTSGFALEMNVSVVRFVRLRGRSDKYWLTSPMLVQSCVLAVPAWVLGATGNEKILERYVMPAVFMLGGFRFRYRPVTFADISVGVTPDLIVFTKDDGLLLQAQLGGRIYPLKGVAVSVFAVRNEYLSFESPSRSFGWGIGAELLLSPKDLGFTLMQ